MLGARQNLPDGSSADEIIPILLVSSDKTDEASVRNILPDRLAAQMACCAALEEAVARIQKATPAVVICESELPDGNWKVILSACETLPKRPLVVVVSRHADDNLWAEVLNLGGYDVLMKPFERSEVVRVLASSCRQWSGTPTRQPATSQTAGGGLTAQFA